MHKSIETNSPCGNTQGEFVYVRCCIAVMNEVRLVHAFRVNFSWELAWELRLQKLQMGENLALIGIILQRCKR